MTELNIIKEIVFNPYVLTIMIVTCIIIIVNRLNLFWIVYRHYDYTKTCKSATDEDLRRWFERAVDPRFDNLNPSWSNAIIKEYHKRKLGVKN